MGAPSTIASENWKNDFPKCFQFQIVLLEVAIKNSKLFAFTMFRPKPVVNSRYIST